MKILTNVLLLLLVATLFACTSDNTKTPKAEKLGLCKSCDIAADSTFYLMVKGKRTLCALCLDSDCIITVIELKENVTEDTVANVTESENAQNLTGTTTGRDGGLYDDPGSKTTPEPKPVITTPAQVKNTPTPVTTTRPKPTPKPATQPQRSAQTKKADCSCLENPAKRRVVAYSDGDHYVCADGIGGTCRIRVPVTKVVQQKTPPVKMDLATTLKTNFQEIANSNNDKFKTDLYYDVLLDLVADENITVTLLGGDVYFDGNGFYDYYNFLNITGGQKISRVEVLGTNEEGKVTTLRVTHQ